MAVNGARKANVLLVGLGSVGSVYAYMLERVSMAFMSIPKLIMSLVWQSASYCSGTIELRLVCQVWSDTEDVQIRYHR